MNNSNKVSLMDRLGELSARIASITYLQVLKNAFTTIMPLFILAGFGTLLNSVIFPQLADGQTLENLQYFGSIISNSTLNNTGLLIAPMIGYYLSKERNFNNSISSIVVSIASFFSLMPLNIETAINNTEELAIVSGVVSYTNLGVNGVFTGIIIGFLATEIFINLSKFDKLQMNMGEGIPPAVSKSFTILIPLFLTVSFFALVSAVLFVFWGANLTAIINRVIQVPLTRIGTSLLGFIVIYSSSIFLFSLGIHHSVITTPILRPVLLINMSENMEAALAGQEAPHIINESFRVVFGQTGGIGSTLPLLFIILLFSKYKPYRNVAKLAMGPGIFQINEPVIFGLPIVFNISMMIPFILAPIVSILIGYFATWVGFIHPFTVLIPWTTPPLLDGFLASGGDWKVIIVQSIAIFIQFLIYIPFLKISEKAAILQAENELESVNQ